MNNKYFILNNGMKIPQIGLGTWQIPNEEVTDVIISSLECGYRHIDTAIDYGNEEGIGLALSKTTVDRKDIFLTSKIPAHIKTYEETKICIEESLKRLNVEYIDLMLIHSPRPWEFLWDENAPRYYKENLEVYRALEEASFQGKIRAIGLSNFFIDDVENIIKNVRIKPVVNQVCVYIGNTPFELMSYCEKNNILIEAYSPIATGRLLNNEEVLKIANKYNVSVPTLCINYCLKLNTIPLPKSTNVKHIKDNLHVEFNLLEKDMDILKKIK